MGVVNALASTWPRRGRALAGRSFADVAASRLDDVRRYLVFLTGDASLADELTAEAFETAFRRFDRFDPRRGGELAWLCAIARSTALDHFRKESRRRRREEAYARDAAREAAEEALGGFSPELDAALRSLTAAEREVIALRIVLDLDAETAARLLGIGRAACSMRLARALARLEERMTTHAVA